MLKKVSYCLGINNFINFSANRKIFITLISVVIGVFTLVIGGILFFVLSSHCLSWHDAKLHNKKLNTLLNLYNRENLNLRKQILEFLEIKEDDLEDMKKSVQDKENEYKDPNHAAPYVEIVKGVYLGNKEASQAVTNQDEGYKFVKGLINFSDFKVVSIGELETQPGKLSIENLKDITESMDKFLYKNGRRNSESLLICNQDSLSMSAMVGISYLVYRTLLDWEIAYLFMLKKYPNIELDDDRKELLKNFSKTFDKIREGVVSDEK